MIWLKLLDFKRQSQVRSHLIPRCRKSGIEKTIISKGEADVLVRLLGAELGKNPPDSTVHDECVRDGVQVTRGG